MNGMEARNYEVSIWTLQDSYITTLKSIGSTYIGQIMLPKIEKKIDGTSSFTCDLPMYLFDNELGDFVENPLWKDKDKFLIENLYKIRVIFNKKELDEEIHDFLIIKVTENHDAAGKLICTIQCEGPAFSELGKMGTDIVLNIDIIDAQYMRDMKKAEQAHEPLPSYPTTNLQFWMDKVLPHYYDGLKEIWQRGWEYEVRMDWSKYPGYNRNSKTIYEEPYNQGWTLTKDASGSTTEAVAIDYTLLQEKIRSIDVTDSNVYNISQDIAEAFGVFCTYEYYYDAKYKVIRKVIVFYNEAIIDDDYTVTYGDNLNEVSRELDGANIYTKMYVSDIESQYMDNGFVTITGTPINLSGENYILNFDYMLQVGNINQEQYDEVRHFELKMHDFNQKIRDVLDTQTNLQNILNDFKTQRTISENSRLAAADALTDYIRKRERYIEDSGTSIPQTVNLDGSTARVMTLSNDRTREGKVGNLHSVGVFANTIQVYRERNGVNLASPITGFTIDYDEFNTPVSVYFPLSIAQSTITAYVTYAYNSLEQYSKIISFYEGVASKAVTTVINLDSRIYETEGDIYEQELKYDALMKEKQEAQNKFNSMMGVALREGVWKNDELQDAGEGYEFNTNDSSQSHVQFKYDDKFFPTEQKGYVGDTSTIVVYNAWVNVDSFLLTSERLDKLQFSVLPVGGTNLLIYNYEANFSLAYYQDGTNYRPIFIFFDADLTSGNIQSIQYYFVDNPGTKWSVPLSNWNTFTSVTVKNVRYARFIITDKNVRSTSSSLSITNESNNEVLEKFFDYSTLMREGLTIFTPKPTSRMTIQHIMNQNFVIRYRVSRANEQLYLDAIKVAKDNSIPIASYTIKKANLPREWRDELLTIGQLVHINDYKMNMHRVKGYVSDYTLNLDEPWNDSCTIQNYKTRFEDLFGRIVASSEQLKVRGLNYEIASKAFNPNHTLEGSILQQAINDNNFFFEYSSGQVQLSESEGILVYNAFPYSNGVTGLVAIKGGGIFLSDSLDSSGNRIWHTGITPSGINANLIRAGRLDTNLINIYSGDNIRFTWRADGLYAFARMSDGSPDLNRFVRYHEDGLLFQNGLDGNGDPIITLKLDWEGLVINELGFGSVQLTAPEGLRVYDQDNVLRVWLGKFDGPSGTQYGLSLYRREGLNSMYSMLTTENGEIWLADRFTVGSMDSQSGLTGRSLTIDEFIDAYSYDSQKFEFEILPQTFTTWQQVANYYSVDVTKLEQVNPSVTSAQLTKDTIVVLPIPRNLNDPVNKSVRFWAGSSDPFGANFYVLQDGSFVATSARISGTVYASEGSFTGAIYATTGIFNGLVYATDGIFKGAIEATTAYFSDRVFIGGQWQNDVFIENETSLILSGLPKIAATPIPRISSSNGTFIVYDDGSLVANNAQIKGDITVTNASIIGDMLIGTNGQSGLTGKTTATGEPLFWVGITSGNNRTTAKFYIDNSGSVYSKEMHLTGSAYIGDYIYLGNPVSGYYRSGLYGGSNVITPPRIWMGASDTGYGLAAFRVYDNGDVFANNLTLTQNLTANAARLSGSLTVSNSNNLEQGFIIQSGTNLQLGYIGTTNFNQDLLGWRINELGQAYFGDAYVRGRIQSTVFEYNKVSALGGDLYISPSYYLQAELKYKITGAINFFEVVNNVLYLEFDMNVSDTIEQAFWLIDDSVNLNGFIEKSGSLNSFEIAGRIISASNNLTKHIRIQCDFNLGLTTSDTLTTIPRGLVLINIGSTTQGQSSIYMTARGPYIQLSQRELVSGTIYHQGNITRLGNLSGIRDSLFGDLIGGYGLYSENAYLTGSLFTPNAGVTSKDVDGVSNNLRMWAGSSYEDAIAPDTTTPFRVYEDGSIFANNGTFTGIINATGGNFTGSILLSYIMVDRNQEPTNDVPDTFYILYGDSPDEEPDYHVDNLIMSFGARGLSIFEGALNVYSDYANGWRNGWLDEDHEELLEVQVPYGDKEKNKRDTTVIYPYISALDEQMVLTTYKNLAWQIAPKAVSVGDLNYTYQSALIENGMMRFGKGDFAKTSQMGKEGHDIDAQKVWNLTSQGAIGLMNAGGQEVFAIRVSDNRNLLLNNYVGNNYNSPASSLKVGINSLNIQDNTHSLTVHGGVKIFDSTNNAELSLGKATIIQRFDAIIDMENGFDIIVS